jgi:NAD(P)-dependent dehydrogenase (short-subunit alcohol dehydrogenase family)
VATQEELGTVPKWPLTGKVVLITGAARGVGAAGAAELKRRGATVVLADLDRSSLERTAATFGPDVLGLELDVTDVTACERAVEATVARHGRLDVVWANAGIASFGPLADTDPEAWARTIEVNLLGSYRTLRAALPEVVRTQGYVAVTASVASFAAAPGMSAYAASKSAVEAMCNALRVEVAHHGVGVASIHPTWLDTDMVREEDQEIPAFARLRASLSPPFSKTYPVERAVIDIADGFERRARRICTPGFVRFAHLFRPILTTRLIERDTLRAAPQIEAEFQRSARADGLARASVSRRVGADVLTSDKAVGNPSGGSR